MLVQIKSTIKINKQYFFMSFKSSEHTKASRKLSLSQEVEVSIKCEIIRTSSLTITHNSEVFQLHSHRFSIQQEPQQLKSGWNKEQEQQLIQLHDSIGNKWALIAQKLTGRTDNCVKNFFYSKLRKTLRKLNKAIHDHFRRDFKQIKMNTIYKVVQAHEQGHKNKTNVQPEMFQHCRKLKNKLLEFSQFDESELSNQTKKLQVKKMIRQIADFNRKYKRKIKRKRRNSGNDQFILGSSKKLKNASEQESQEEISEDIYINRNETENQIFTTFINLVKKESEKIFQDSISCLPSPKPQQPKKLEMVEEKEEDIENILQCEGMIENDYNMPPLLFLRKDLSKLSIFSGRCSQGLDHDLFQESGMPILCSNLSRKRSQFNNIY